MFFPSLVIPPNSGCQLGITPIFAFNGNCTPNACITNLTLDITGATGQTAYLWNDGSRDAARFGLCAGNYTVTIVDAASCEVTRTIFVPSYNVLTVAAISTPAQGGNNGKAFYSSLEGLGSFVLESYKKRKQK